MTRDMDRWISRRTDSLEMCIYLIIILDFMQISCCYYIMCHLKKSSSTSHPHNIFPIVIYTAMAC